MGGFLGDQANRLRVFLARRVTGGLFHPRTDHKRETGKGCCRLSSRKFGARESRGEKAGPHWKGFGAAGSEPFRVKARREALRFRVRVLFLEAGGPGFGFGGFLPFSGVIRVPRPH